MWINQIAAAKTFACVSLLPDAGTVEYALEFD